MILRREPQLPMDGVAPPGLHAYTQGVEGGQTRLHLRVEPSGHGLLLINANRALHLNPTAALLAWMILERIPIPACVRQLRRAYRVSKTQAKRDLEAMRHQMAELSDPAGACPVHDLALEVDSPFSHIPQAPYRMDLALTYRCNCDCAHCYNARSRTYPEMDTDHWCRILDLLWEIGIPHICFTGGEATLRQDLPELISHAQGLGQITGLLSNGRRLADPAYVQALSEAGLDHVQITLESHDPEIHDRMVRAKGAWNQTVGGIRNALGSGLFVMTNTTLLQPNVGKIEDTLHFLAELGVPTVGFNALIHAGAGEVVGTGLREARLGPLLEIVRQRTSAAGQRLIWYTPTQYCHFDPMQMELGVKACTAAIYNMCIEPDGAVIPCQSYYRGMGNILQDDWNDIWNHELARWLRERRYAPEKCRSCAVLAECGGGCPLSLVEQEPVGLPVMGA
jgi:radical SAM protein with 4Fe4S-binding SPASM domain